MGRHKDHSPVSQTCPMIDGVLDKINSIYQNSGDEFSKGDLKYIEETLEKIRSHNGALRDWGNEYCNKESELADEVDELNRTIERLNDEVSSLNSQIKELENNLQEINN